VKPLCEQDNDNETDCGLLSLPQDTKLIIFSLCPLWVLCGLVTVSKSFYDFICCTAASATQLDIHILGSPENAQKVIVLLARYSSSLRNVVGVVVGEGPSLSMSGRIEKSVSFRCPPELVYDILRRNQQLEHVVLYDFDEMEEKYVDKLFDALSSCSYLKLLYSETSLWRLPKIQELIKTHKYLTELSFPNLCNLRKALSNDGWSGFYPTSTGIRHRDSNAFISVLRKGGDPPLIISEPPKSSTKTAFNPTVDLLKQPTGNSGLRQSIGRTRVVPLVPTGTNL